MIETSPEYGEALYVYRQAQVRLDLYESDGRALLGHNDETLARQAAFQNLVVARDDARAAVDLFNSKK